jgi:hypothetical protein
MGISTGFVVVMAINLLIVVSFVGFVILSLSTSKTTKKYRAHIRELKKQNTYEEWVEKHKNLVMAQKIFQYSAVVFILALLVFLGIVKEVFPAPGMVLIVSGILVYAFWPFSFILMLVISRLYKKVPEFQSQE